MLVDDILEHHGIKGQRWGVRRSEAQLNNGTSGKRESLSSRAKSLSDDDLKKLIARMELEKKFKDLSRGPKIDGKKFANELISNSGKTVVGAVLGGATAHLVKKALTK